MVILSGSVINNVYVDLNDEVAIRNFEVASTNGVIDINSVHGIMKFVEGTIVVGYVFNLIIGIDTTMALLTCGR